jgi:hypothetical protein
LSLSNAEIREPWLGSPPYQMLFRLVRKTIVEEC